MFFSRSRSLFRSMSKRKSSSSVKALAWALAVGSLGMSCGNPGVDGSAHVGKSAQVQVSEGSDRKAAHHLALASKKERLPNAKEHFQRVKDSLLSKYYDDKVTEDDLYRAAIQGMLTYLDSGMSKWNHLLDPEELAELQGQLAGEIVGIGVQIKFDETSGTAEVLGALPGSAAEKAGLGEGDRVLSVDGKTYRGKSLREMVYDIRGKAGEVVTLSILRGAEVVQKTIRREKVTWDTVSHRVLPGNVGYLDIGSFNANTEKAARAALADFASKKVTGLVVDLRDNPGGSFDVAVATCSLLLSKGQNLVQVVRRGDKKEMFSAKGEPLLSSVPVVILVSGKTSSGGEFCAAGLNETLKAPLVGDKTLGKWSVQTIEELGEHHAIKYTISVFQTPSGKSYEGQGISPDVQVNAEEKDLQRAERAKDVGERLLLDVQLRTALRLLAPR